MNFKPFNIHRFTNGKTKAKFRGFTAIVEPAQDRNVHVRMTFCSSKDMYCKKEGVRQAQGGGFGFDFECNARDLLKELQTRARKVNVARRVYVALDLETWLFKYML